MCVGVGKQKQIDRLRTRREMKASAVLTLCRSKPVANERRKRIGNQASEEWCRQSMMLKQWFEFEQRERRRRFNGCDHYRHECFRGR